VEAPPAGYVGREAAGDGSGSEAVAGEDGAEQFFCYHAATVLHFLHFLLFEYAL
jgi:hypothetical protein